MADPLPVFDAAAARADGVSDADIAAFLAPKVGFNLEQARKDGVTDSAIVDFLAPTKEAETTAPKPKASIGDDLNRSWQNAVGMVQGIRGDMAAEQLSHIEAAKKKADAGEYLTPWEKKTVANYDQAATEARGKTASLLGSAQGRRDKAEALPISKEYKEYKDAKDGWGKIDALWKAPGEVLSSILAENAVSMAVTGGAAMVGGVGPGFVAATTSTFGQSYAGKLLELLSEKGVDIRDRDAVMAALADPAIAKSVRNDAALSALPEAAAAGLAMGVAPLTLAPKSLAGSAATATAPAVAARPIMQQAVNIPAQAAVQGTLGAAGTAGSMAVLGEDLDSGKIVESFIGEAAGGLTDVGAFAARRAYDAARSPKVVADKVMATETVDAAIAEARAAIGEPVDTDAVAAMAQDLGSTADQQQAKMLKLFGGLNEGTVEQVPDGAVSHLAEGGTSAHPAYQYRYDDETKPAVPLKVWDERTPAVEGVKTIAPDLAAVQRRVYGDMGIDVVYIDDATGKVPFDGAVSPRNPNTIFLSNNPERNAANVGAHEVTHVLETVTTPDGQRLGDLMHDMIVQNVTGAGIDQYIKIFGKDAPARADFEDGAQGDSRHADAVWRHITQELGADIGGEAPKFPTFVAKVVDEVQARYGDDAAKGVLRQLMDGIQQAMRRLREFFSRGDPGAEYGVPDTVSQNWLTNLGEFHDLLAKGYAEKFGTQAERENVALRDMRDRAARDRAIQDERFGVSEIPPPAAPEGFLDEALPARTPAYQEAAQRLASYRRWMGQLDEQRRQEAKNSPQVTLLRQTEAAILGKVNGVESQMKGAPAVRLEQVRAQIDGLLNPATDTPDMARVRKAMEFERGRMAEPAAAAEPVTPIASETSVPATEPAPEPVTPAAPIDPAAELPTDPPADPTYAEKVAAEKDRVWEDKAVMGRVKRGLPRNEQFATDIARERVMRDEVGPDAIAAAIEQGLRNVAQRMDNADENMVETIMERGSLDRPQAEAAFAELKRAKALKRDAVGGRWSVKHGAFMEPDVLRRAAGVDEQALVEAPDVSADMLDARQRQADKQEAEARMRGRKGGKAGQQVADDLPLFGGDRQKMLFSPKQTQTPEFRRWFGDSKVVDEEGKPRVVYHGTHREVEQFARTDRSPGFTALGHWFTAHPDEAGVFAGHDPNRAADSQFGEGSIYPTYLSIKNPLEFSNAGEFWKWAEDYALFHGHGGKGANDRPRQQWTTADADLIRERLRLGGKDGIIIKGGGESDGLPTKADWYIALHPEQIKSAIGNNGQFDRANPDIRFSPKPFYSALTRGVEALKLDKATPGQWEATVRNMPGVKAEERAWVGLEDWLKTQPKSVTKAEVLGYLRANEITVQEVEKGLTRAAIPDEAIVGLKAWAEETYGKPDENADVTDADFAAAQRGDAEAISKLESLGAPGELMQPIYDGIRSEGATKFSSYVLPGGENYRELLLTLPENTAVADAIKAAHARREAIQDEFDAMYGQPDSADLAQRRADLSAEQRALYEEIVQLEGGRGPRGWGDTAGGTRDSANFRGGHWDEPNVLAHIRFDDRTGPNGERVLHIAEIQSDWHQKGRKQGYSGVNAVPLFDVYSDGRVVASDLNEAQADAWQAAHPEQGPFEVMEHEFGAVAGGVPDAPFKTTWPELAMKRMLRYASENGYDRVSWDTGETNAARFDLSKQVDSIDVVPRTDSRTGEQTRSVAIELKGNPTLILGVDANGVVDNARGSRNTDLVGKSLADVVGKDMAEKIMANNRQKIEGEGLRLGGEGMAAFYDKQLPVIANKLGKKFGAKVESTNLELPRHQNRTQDERYEATREGFGIDEDEWATMSRAERTERVAEFEALPESRGAAAHSIAITDAMRDGVMQGQPLFSPKIAGANPNRTYTPAEKKAFENVGRAMEPFSVRAWIDEQKANLGKRLIAKTLDPYIGIKASDPAGYMALRNANTTSGALEVFKEFGTIKFEGNAYALDKRNGGVDNDLIKPLQGEASDFIWWVAANRAERLKAEDRENLWSAEDIAVIKKTNEGELGFDYMLPNGTITRRREVAYTDSLRKLDTFNKNALDLAVESGLLKRDQVDALWSNPFYVPFYRQAEGERQFIGPNVKGGFVKQHAFKQLKGGSEKLRTHLWENAFGNWEHMIDAAMSNRAVSRVLDVASGPGGAAREMTLQEVKYLSDKELKKRTVWIMRNGERVHYEITDPMLFDAVSTLESLSDPLRLLSAGRWFKKVLTVGVTLNPGFAARNLIRDTQQTMATAPSSLNIAGNMRTGFGMSDLSGALGNVWKAAWALEQKKLNLSDDAVSAIAGGATMRLATGSDTGIRDTKLSAILDTPESVKGFTNYLGTLANAYREVIGQGEDVNRFALYRKLRSEGIPHDAASFAARDLADFTLSGAATPVRYIIGVVPFLNARLQGLYKVGRAATNADAGVNAATGLGTKSSVGRLATILGASALAMMALDAIYSDDEDYKKRTEFDRNTYFWFKFGNAQIRIPMGFEIAALGRMASNTAESFYDKDMTVKRVMENGWALLGQQLQMNPIPQAVKPLFDIAENESGTGRRIEPMGSEKLRPEQRYTANNTLIGRGVSTGINAAMRAIPGLSHAQGPSSMQLDYLVNAYGGWLATQALGMADMVVRSVSNEPVRPARDFWAVATQGMVSTEPRAESRYIDMLYRQGAEIERTYATYRDMLMRGQAIEAQRFFENNRETLQKHGLVSGLMRLESDLNRQIRMITNNPDPRVTAEQKKLQIMRITKLKSDAAERVFSVR